MKKIIAIAILLFAGYIVKAQNYPSEWSLYMSDAYYSAVESGINEQNLPEEKFRNELLDIARANLAKQIKVKVNDVSLMNKEVVNGKSEIYYASSRKISTNVEMRFAESKSHIDIVTGKQFVIVYINKLEACRYYENEIKQQIGKIENYVTIADNYTNTGFKAKAKEELQKALALFDNAGEIVMGLNVFGMPDYQMGHYINRLNQQEQNLKTKIADLEYGTTYCIVCNADNFGKAYPKLKNEVKGDLSASGCNFVDDQDSADYVIYIDASSREYNTVVTGNITSYYSFVDAVIAIDKVVTNQRIFEDEISLKGAHTLSFDEAGRDGYKKIRKEISKIIKENIEL